MSDSAIYGMKRDHLGIEIPIIVLPHVRYLASEKNYNPQYVYKKYIGNADCLTHGKTYRFHHAMYSPSPGIPYKERLVTKSDIGPYVRYEDTRKDWV